MNCVVARQPTCLASVCYLEKHNHIIKVFPEESVRLLSVCFLCFIVVGSSTARKIDCTSGFAKMSWLTTLQRIRDSY